MKKTALCIGFAIILFAACKKTETQIPEPQKPTPITPDPPKPPAGGGTTLSITGFSPASAKALDTINITGTGFGTMASDIWVDFGGSRVRPNFISTTTLKAVIPIQAKSGKIRVSLKDSVNAFSQEIFTKIDLPTAIPVKIVSIVPIDKARSGDTLVINGSGFGSDPSKIIVKFGTYASVKPFSVQPTTLSLLTPLLPYNVPSAQVTVQNGSESFTTVYSLGILKPNPIITDFSPKIVVEGDTLKISGKYFKTENRQIVQAELEGLNTYNVFDFNKSLIIYESDTELRVRVKLREKAVRKVPITIYIRDEQDSYKILSKSMPSTDVLTTLPKTVVQYVSGSGADQYNYQNPTTRIGETVVIIGDYLVNEFSSIKVRFSGSSIDVKPETTGNQLNNRILVKVPSDAKTGQVKVSKFDWAAGTTQNTLTILR